MERVFPKFWCKWKTHKDELVAIIDCYTTSNAMRRAGILRDAVAKSYGGLEIIAGLVLGKTIRSNPQKPLNKVLQYYRIPHRHLDSSNNPLTHQLCSDLGIVDNHGARLLVEIRNYIVHPLDDNTMVKPRHLQYVDGDMTHYVPLHDLSQFYLEYLVLRFCGHTMANYRQLLEIQRG